MRVIEAAFPGMVRDGASTGRALRQAVLADPDALTRLEHILHPMVEAAERAFVGRARRRGAGRWCWIFRCCSRSRATSGWIP